MACCFYSCGGNNDSPKQNNLFLSLIILLCISVGAGAAGALNMWWDKEIDNLMERTSGRPLPSEKISSDDAFVFGLSLSMFSVMFLGLVSNWLAAFLLGVTIFFYLVIYSIFFKKNYTPKYCNWGSCWRNASVNWLGSDYGNNLSRTPFVISIYIFLDTSSLLVISNNYKG